MFVYALRFEKSMLPPPPEVAAPESSTSMHWWCELVPPPDAPRPYFVMSAVDSVHFIVRSRLDPGSICDALTAGLTVLSVAGTSSQTPVVKSGQPLPPGSTPQS